MTAPAAPDPAAAVFAAFTLSELADRFGVNVLTVKRWQLAGAVPPRYAFRLAELHAELCGAPAPDRALLTGPRGPVTTLAESIEPVRLAMALSLRDAAELLGCSPTYLARIEAEQAQGLEVRVEPTLADRVLSRCAEWRIAACTVPRRVRYQILGLGWSRKAVASHLRVDTITARAWLEGHAVVVGLDAGPWPGPAGSGLGAFPISARQLRLLGLAPDGAFLTDVPLTFWEAVCRAGGVGAVAHKAPDLTPAKLRAWMLAAPTVEDQERISKGLGVGLDVVGAWWP